MLLPSISLLFSGVGVTTVLFAINWLIWGNARNLRLNPKTIALAGPPSHADVYAAKPTEDDGFKHVA
jgi:hypothetical protein